jgi:hypothetical protein
MTRARGGDTSFSPFVISIGIGDLVGSDLWSTRRKR